MNAQDNKYIILITVLLEYIDFHDTLVSISPTSMIEFQYYSKVCYIIDFYSKAHYSRANFSVHNNNNICTSLTLNKLVLAPLSAHDACCLVSRLRECRARWEGGEMLFFFTTVPELLAHRVEQKGPGLEVGHT